MIIVSTQVTTTVLQNACSYHTTYDVVAFGESNAPIKDASKGV